MIQPLRTLLRTTYSRWVDYASTRPRQAALLLCLVVAPFAVLSVRFFSDVRAGLSELLPKTAPSVRSIEAIHARIGGKSQLTVIADSPTPALNRRFIDQLCARIVARRIPEARSVQCGVKVERAWLRDHAALLMPRPEFEAAMQEVDEAITAARSKANPFFIDVGDSDGASDSGDGQWQKLERRLDAEVAARDRFVNGYLETPDGHTVVLLIWLAGSEIDMGPSQNLMTAVKQEVATLTAGGEFSSLRVAYNGEVANLIEEHDAILADLSLSSLLVFLLVGGLIVAYFRSVRSILATVAMLAPGLIVAFGIGRLTVDHLNSNTAFLGSIIAGNGINYPLLLLAYYRRRSPDEARPRAIYAAARGALPGTVAAAVTASAAYGGLAATQFRGFSQFGWLGGMGMITMWLVTFLAAPIAIGLLDPPRHGAAPTRAQAALGRFFARRRLSLGVAAAFVGATLVVGGIGVRRALSGGLYEMDLQTMRNRDSLAHGSASWDRRMSELFGVWMNPVATLVEDPADREATAAELRRVIATGPGAVAERVDTIAQFVPAASEQAARIARLEQLRTSLARLPRDEIPERARPFIDAWLAPENLRPITDRDVPEALRQGFAEVSGRSDRVVLIYPSLAINYNDGRNIIAFADRLATAKPTVGAVTGGSFLFMSEVIRLVRDESSQVALVVCLLVALVLVPTFSDRLLRIPLVVLSVAVVAVASQAVMFALGVRLNMLNFAAVPITIGVGADYIVNLLGAMESLETDARSACASMGGAILLCSLTTVVGYISLVLAQSGALRTFGWSAVLGELMAVTTVLLVVPALWPRRRPDETPPA